MSEIGFKLPATELGIIWRYLDGVSQALARRFDGGSSPGEENLTFLLCELLDEGTTGLHMLEYPLKRAKEDLAQADGGITLDVSFQTHEHTKHVEHHFSGADLGIVFVLDHPFFGRSEKAVLLQAKRLFPSSSGRFSLNSSFSSFHAPQRNLLTEVERRFSAAHSIFYLWYAPSSDAFPDDDAKLLRSLEATTSPDWHDLRGRHPFLDDMIEFGWPWYERRWGNNPPSPQDDERQRAWRAAQPAARVSSLSVVSELTANGQSPRLISLYEARGGSPRRRRPWRWLAFEPLAELFLLGLLSDGIGQSSSDWLRLARGEKIPMPALRTQNEEEDQAPDIPDRVPAPRHSLTITLRSSLNWPQDVRRTDQ
jgi:hypothetical protein